MNISIVLFSIKLNLTDNVVCPLGYCSVDCLSIRTGIRAYGSRITPWMRRSNWWNAIRPRLKLKPQRRQQLPWLFPCQLFPQSVVILRLQQPIMQLHKCPRRHVRRLQTYLHCPFRDHRHPMRNSSRGGLFHSKQPTPYQLNIVPGWCSREIHT